MANRRELEQLVGFWRTQFRIERAQLDEMLANAEQHRRLSEGCGVDADLHSERFRATCEVIAVMRSHLGETAIAYANAIEDLEALGLGLEDDA